MPLAEGRLERLQILKLLQCVRNEDVEQIEKLITNGVPHLVNYSEPESGETALHLAASQNNEKIISLLLDLGASPNMVDLKGRSPAMRAVELGHVQALILLTEAGTDMTIRDIENKGILFYCLQPTRRHLDCLRLSIDHGASVNNVSKDGQPLIVVAAEAGLEEMTKVLLESGSNPNSKHEKTGFTALQAAAMSGSLECARAILEAGADYDVIDNENVHAAHKAASKGYLDIIRLLAAYGADLGKVSLDGNTPMHLAAAKGFGAVCKFLGQRGCSSTFKNKEGKTPKMLAKDNEHKEALKECKKAEKVAARLAKGTGKGPGAPYAVRLYDWLQEHEKRVLNMFHQFDQEDKEGKFKGKVTQENFVVCLQTLNVPVEAEDLQKLALVHDPNKEDNVDYNLFLTGKKFINKQYMVSQGKKKKKKGGKKGRRKKGKTKVPLPICTAPDGPRTKNGGPPPNYVERYVSFTDYTRFNRDHPPTHPIQDDSAWYLNSPETTYISINDAAKMGDLESIKVAIYRGMSVDQRDKFFKTPLMTSCAHGNIEMARALLDFGADVNAKDSFRWTPLHHACHCGQVDLVSLLLDKGAELDAQTFSHGTPLMRAIESSREEVVALLISKGAKVQLQNKKGHTALDIAKAYADPRVVAIVQKRWDEIPPPVNKKKRGGGPGGRQKGGAKSAASKTHMPKVGTKVKVPVLETKEEVLTSTHSENTNNRTSSVLRAVSALGIANEKPPPLVFVPKRAWVSQPTTEDLLRDREVRRSRFGSDIDFDDYLPAFQKHISQKSLALQKLYA